MTQPHLTVEWCTTLNPSTLMPTAQDGEPHDCMAEITISVLPRPDLTDTPYENAEITMFVEGSSRKNPDGINATRFAVVTETEVLLKQPLPKKFKNNIYTDSQYAFLTVHVFAQQWKNRGMTTSQVNL